MGHVQRILSKGEGAFCLQPLFPFVASPEKVIPK